MPALLPTALPVHRVVKVDVFLPGCPPSADLIYHMLHRAARGADARHAQRPLRRLTGATPSPTEIVIDPVTRIEGHAKITIQLDDDGQVADAHFHVTQFRGFERICQGRPVHELPSIMARICGICPVSHLIASAKACDEILAVEPPPAGVDLRRVMNLAQVVQSHALSFFHLSSPDLLFGFDAEPGGRHLFGVAAANPQLARDGVGLRRFGQQVIESLGGKRIHPSGSCPAGSPRPWPPRPATRSWPPCPRPSPPPSGRWPGTTASCAGSRRRRRRSATSPRRSWAWSTPTATVEHYDGPLRVVGADGTKLAERVDPRPYWEYLGEAVEPWSYLKSTYWKDLGYPDGVYRVGPLAR